MTRIGLLWLVAFNAYLLGATISDIGEVPKCDNEPYGWDLPLIILACVSLPTVLGYLFGRADGKEGKK